MLLALRLLLGFSLSMLIGLIARRHRHLSGSGLVGAVLIGTAIFGFGGLVWSLFIVIFFVTSSLLSKAGGQTKETLAATTFDKTGERDLGQTLANGGAGTLLAIVYAIYPNPAIFAAYVGAIAAVTSDTWATELGTLAARPPRLITNFRPVERGTSGGVTWLGSLSALAGALLIGASGMVLVATEQTVAAGLIGHRASWIAIFWELRWLLIVAIIGGLAGSYFDSLLGASVQAIYFSEARHRETEKRTDPDGKANILLRGWRWLDNDAVNFVSSVAGAACAGLISLLVR